MPTADAAAQDPALVAPAPEEVTGPLATVVAEDVALRVWESADSPTYAGSLAKGTVVRIGEERGGFRQVLLPVGPVGYVHKNFANEPQGSRITTKGKAVSFRYRPRSGEAPVTTMAENTELWVVGLEDDWWRVRYPARDCWVPAASIEVFDTPGETMRKSYVEFVKVQLGEIQAYAQAQQDKLAAQAREAEQLAKVSGLLTAYQAELQKDLKEQQLAAIDAAAETVLTELGEDSPVRGRVVDLRRRIATQKWVQDAVSVRNEEPVPAQVETSSVVPVVRDPLERFQAVGFLRWEKGLIGPGRFIVEKGGHPLYIVSCDSNRYELALFVDHEVGLVGSRRRPATESLRVLDVEKIEVLTPGR